MLGSGEVLKLNNLPRERGGEEGEVVKLNIPSHPIPGGEEGFCSCRRCRFCQTSSVNGDPLDLFDQPLLLDMIFLGTQKLCGGVYILFFFKVSFEKHPNVYTNTRTQIPLDTYKQVYHQTEIRLNYAKCYNLREILLICVRCCSNMSNILFNQATFHATGQDPFLA